jgi:hypothetical protein
MLWEHRPKHVHSIPDDVGTTTVVERHQHVPEQHVGLHDGHSSIGEVLVVWGFADFGLLVAGD